MFTTFILSRTHDSGMANTLYTLFKPMESPYVTLPIKADTIQGDFPGVVLYTDKPITDMCSWIVKTCFDYRDFRIFKWPRSMTKEEIIDYVRND